MSEVSRLYPSCFRSQLKNAVKWEARCLMVDLLKPPWFFYTAFVTYGVSKAARVMCPNLLKGYAFKESFKITN